MPRAQTTPIIGLPQFNGWSQVVTNPTGSLVFAFSIFGENANGIGRDIVEDLSDFNPKAAVDLHHKILDLLQKVRTSGNDLQLSAILLNETKITLATFNGFILLDRNNKVGKIIASTSQPQIIEGQKKEGDLYILGTNQASSFSEEIKQKIKQGFDVDTVITSILPILHSQEDSSLCAIAFTQIIPDIVKIKKEDFIETQTKEVKILVDKTFQEIPQTLPDKNPAQTTQQIQTIKLAQPIEHTYPVIPKPKKQPKRLKLPKINFKFNIKPFITIIKRFFIYIINLVKNIIKKIIYLIKTAFQWINNLKKPKGYTIKTQDNKKAIRTAVLIISIVGGLGIFLFIRNQTIKKELEEINAKIDPITQQLEITKQLTSNNILAARQETNELLAKLRTLAEETQNNKRQFNRVKEELARTQEFLESISGEDSLNQLPLFFDLRLVEINFVVSKAVANDNFAYFMDIGTKQVIRINLENKQTKIFKIEENINPVDISLTDNSFYILGNGLHKYNPKEESSKITIKEEGSSDKDGLFLGNFGKYLYIFNPEKRNIYRYLQKSDDSVSDPIGWLVSKKDLDFEQISSMVIDGDIWMTTKDGQIKKFSKGSEADFIIDGLKTPFGSNIIINTRENLENLYILEPDKNRVVILTKEGQFLREISSESFASATAIIASETLNKIFAASGSIIFEVEL